MYSVSFKNVKFKKNKVNGLELFKDRKSVV